MLSKHLVEVMLIWKRMTRQDVLQEANSDGRACVGCLVTGVGVVYAYL